MNADEAFEDPRTPPPDGAALVLDLEGYEGPIDVLLALARTQKVDITKISILMLAEQYLEFIAAARRLDLELAADYLVMAAWLAYLKSRLLLPEPEPEEGDQPSAAEMAESLSYQLRRLQSMRDAGERLMDMPRLGRDFFARGAPEGVTVVRKPVYELTLFELLRAYGDQARRKQNSVLSVEASDLYSMDEALERLRGLIGDFADWRNLASLVPPEFGEGIPLRSAVAATFAAGLELVRSGQLELRQGTAFGPIYVRRSRLYGANPNSNSNPIRNERAET